MSDRLRTRLAELGMRGIDLADATGISESYTSLILSGRREPPAHLKAAIAQALDCRVRDLWPPAEQQAVGA